MTDAEKEDLFDVFNRLGLRMGLQGLPKNYKEWTVMREEHLQQDLAKSHFTTDLYKQYRKHLGPFRYWLLKESQKLVVPARVKELLNLGGFSSVKPILFFYKISRKMRLDAFLKSLVMPKQYQKQIKDLDIVPT